MKRVLIVKLWALGDLLMATPLVSALRAQYPDVHIAWIADNLNADLLEGQPGIDEVIHMNSGIWRRKLRKGNIAGWLKEARFWQRTLKQRRFDAVINCHPDLWWTRILCQAPVRVGLFHAPKPSLVRHLYTYPIAKMKVHNTDYYLEGLKALGLPGPFDRHMKYEILPEAQAEASAFLAASPEYDPKLPVIVLHPGTSQESKSWLPENFAAVASALSPRFNVVITGSPKETALAEKIRAQLPPETRPPLVAAGRFENAGVLAALIGQAAAVVSGDTLALHLASMLETPLVGIYGGSRPNDNAPLFGLQALLFDNSIPCAPCYKERCPLHGAEHLRCQRAVTPNQVLKALEALWKEDPCKT
jgi:lipopolysaccharide heptosyltransferase II